MLKKLQAQTWTCSRCLLRQKQWRRSLVGIASAAAQNQEVVLPIAKHDPPGAIRDDQTLRKIFDSSHFWKEFSQRTRGTGKRAGLLQNRYLTEPEGFRQFSADALQKCQRLVQKILSAKSVAEYQGMARDMDRLSDLLCRVIDLVDFIRSVHPDHRIQQAASEAHAIMFEYMNVLNTTTGLNDQLETAVSMPEVTSSWSEEENAVVRILLKDFSQSALREGDEARGKFVEISNEIRQLGADMVDYMAPAKSYLHFSSAELNGMDPMFVRRFTRDGKSKLPMYGIASTLALRTVEDQSVRQRVYMASRSASNDSIKRLEELAAKRAELATLAGYQSFAEMALVDKMAKTPEAVNRFLEALAMDNKSIVTKDLAELLALKQSDPKFYDQRVTINAWDRDFYTSKLRSRLSTASRPSDVLSSYFSLGTVMQGLSRLFDRLYGIRLVPHEIAPGETWNDDVRRLDVIDEKEGLIAVMYCDLFQRPNKSPNPAHFTLRCSRQISALEISEASHMFSANPTLSEFSQVLNDGMATALDPNTQTLHQLPTIALICDFPTAAPNTPALLTYSQLSTLFHEMGHALHSILGRTTLQNVAGTRCATDFAELPSILMEHFASAPEVLALYARHWSTDAPLDPALVAQKVAVDARISAAADTEMQICLSVLDQRLHAAGAGGAPSKDVYQAVWNDPRFASVPEPRGTSWHGFFGHLFGYGAVYYSYLFDRAIARKVFKEVFAGGQMAVDRRAGQRYRDEVLKWGGSRDGWRCVAGVLGERYKWMDEGGEAAMAEVGKWGGGGL